MRNTNIQINCDKCGRDISEEYFVIEVKYIHTTEGMPSHPANLNQELCYDCVLETVPSLKVAVEKEETDGV